MLYLLRLDPHLPWQPAAVEAATRAAYDGFRAAAAEVPGDAQLGIVVDEQSRVILRDANAAGFRTVCTVGPVDDLALDTEGADTDAVHVGACEATYWRVIVRFNPDNDGVLTARQVARLQRLSGELLRQAGPRLICDLVVAPTQWQLAHGIRAFDLELLPQLTRDAMAWLVGEGVAPELWAIEGLHDPIEYEKILAVAKGHENTAGCLVRAAGHSDATTFDLMTVGLSCAGVAGVVLGPAPFWQPVESWMLGRTTRARAVAAVAEQFRTWVTRLDESRSSCGQGEPCPAQAALPGGHTSPSAPRPSVRTGPLHRPVS
jgi:myo-inositol catabolism protein IolC